MGKHIGTTPPGGKRVVTRDDRDAADALVGRLLSGKWRIDGLLNRGGTSWVYSARHRNGRRVAIKVLRPEYAADARMRRRFLSEGYLAHRVGHAGAVAILDDDTTEDCVFLVMELLDGVGLDRLGGQGARDPGEVLFLVDQLLDILAAAHASGIVHRDVKPSNVFVATNGAVKLLDFGIARLTNPSSALLQTHHDAVLGTPGFMAPEQARARWNAVDARTDIWAVGATMFWLFTGRRPHEAPSVQEAMIAAATSPAPAIQTVRADLPDPLAALVDRALAFEQDARWQSATEMREAIRAIGARLPPFTWRHQEPAAVEAEPVETSDETPTTSFLDRSRPRGPNPRPIRRPFGPRMATPALAAVVGATVLFLGLRTPARTYAGSSARMQTGALVTSQVADESPFMATHAALPERRDVSPPTRAPIDTTRNADARVFASHHPSRRTLLAAPAPSVVEREPAVGTTVVPQPAGEAKAPPPLEELLNARR